MWSKIFALHPQVLGWQALLNQYWIGHDREPFADYWTRPDLLNQFDWSQSNWYVTSISVPYALNGQLTVPNFENFVSGVKAQGHTVKIAMLGRDRNIVGLQENRVRGCETFEQALACYQQLIPDQYLSYELLHLYRDQYLKTISRQLNFPIDHAHVDIEKILAVDTNSKYFAAVTHQDTDSLAQQSSRKWK